MAKPKPKAKAAAPKKAAAKPSPKKPVAKRAPVKETKKAPPEPKKLPQKQMTGKPRKAVKGDNGGPDSGLDFDTGQESVRKDPKALQAMIDKGNELLDLQAKADKVSELLSDLNSQIGEIQNKELPKMMNDLQLTSFGVKNGSTIELTDKLIGSLPKDPAGRAKAFEIIEERDGGDIIKSEVSIPFAKSDYDKAKALVEELKEDKGIEATLDVNVHHQTLLAWAKEVIEDEEAQADNPLPLADLGLSFIHFARVKEAKKASKAGR